MQSRFSTVVSSLSSKEFAPRRLTLARHFLLSDDAGDAPGRVQRTRFAAAQVLLAEGSAQSWVTVTRVGKFFDPRYGEFEISPTMLQEMVRNFEARVLGQDVFIDVAHKPNDGSAGQVMKLAIENGRLRALVQWTEFGQKAIRDRGFSYLSAEFHEDWEDNEKRARHGCVLLGAGLTLRPVIKHLDRVQLSESEYAADEAKTAIDPNFIKQSLELSTMNYIAQLKARLLALGLTEAQIKPILDAAQKQLSAAAADDAKCLGIVEAFAIAGQAMSDQVKALSAPPAAALAAAPAAAPAAPQAVALSEDAVTAAVHKALAAAADAQAAQAKSLADKVKALGEQVNAVTTLSEQDRTLLLAEATPMVTADMSPEQVKRLGEFMLSQAAKTAAAKQLSGMGYVNISGNARITVDSSNQIKSLQEQVDRRLGISLQDDATRYERTGGSLLKKNKEFAERALAQFDEIHGARLAEEHKALAAGVGSIGDFAVPAVFERTVLREALYGLQGLGFVDVGVYPMSAVVQIPYSYRDTSAAGVGAVRTYELQGIRNAGVIQTFEEARPIPQKLAFSISNEMRYLLAAAPIDFDPLAENVRNVIRIVGEDTDRIIHNELINSADEALNASVTDTLTAQVNGTNRIFVLTQFPVLRPRMVYDLKGVQVGSTLFPIVVTLNSVVRTEYRTGVTLAAGLYYVMDYNLGEIRFVNEAGVLQTPTSAWVLTVSYSWTQNVVKANLDIGAAPDSIGLVYDRVLTQIGARKVVIENDRYYTANMLLQSGAIDNALGQAITFQANSSRPGTNLAPDGSVGRVKNIPAFNTKAPGLLMGDNRILVGERANTRFRMLRPFQMADMQQRRNTDGNFVGAQDNYGEQFVACHTPTQLKNATTSVVLFSSAARVARAS
jgi:hypothetical protein